MNITHSFAQYMQAQGYGTLGTSLFIGVVPQDAPDACFWVISSGGTNQSRNNTGERVKNYLISVFYRSMDSEDVYDKLQSFEELINGKQCVTLTTYDTIQAQATLYPTDQDIDSEERTIGLVQVSLTIYSN